jgi:peptide/nickel transport system substrate-binding protein
MPRILYSGTEPLGHDMAKARRLLSESAYPSGFSARLLVPPYPSFADETAVMLKSQLDVIGIRVQILKLEGAHFDATLDRGDYDMTLVSFTADTFDPAEATLYNVVSSGFLATMFGYRNPEVDALAAKAQAENDNVQRAALYRKIEQVVHDDGPHVPLFLMSRPVGLRQDVHNLIMLPNTDSYRLWEIWKSQ